MACRWKWSLKSFEVMVIEIGTNRKLVRDFLLVFYGNYMSFFYRFRDILIYWSKVCVFHHFTHCSLNWSQTRAWLSQTDRASCAHNYTSRASIGLITPWPWSPGWSVKVTGNGTIGYIILLLYYCDLEMWVRGHSGSLKMVPFESFGTVSYSPSIVTMAISDIFSVKVWRDLEICVLGLSMSLKVARFDSYNGRPL